MPEIGELPGGGRPYGNIYTVQTPNLDRVSQQFQQMALDRKAYAQKEGQQTNELVNKELANVRSVDMGAVSDYYNKWKQLSQPLYFNKSLLNDPKKYNEAQMQANAALGELRAQINKSSHLNQFGKQLYTERNTAGKSNLYSDDFGDKATAFWNTPMDQLQKHAKYGDLTNPDVYRYQGMNNVNFGALEKTAAGTPAQRYQKEEQISPLQKNITPYTFGNTPAQFQQALRGQYASNPQTYRAASAAWEAIPQSEKDRVDQTFSQLPKEKWEQMGAGGAQAIEPTNPSDPADNLAAYKAKVYAINNNPSAGKVYSNVDQNAKIDKQASLKLKGQEIMAAINEGNREKLKAIGHEYKKMDHAAQSMVLDDAYNDLIDKAKKGKPYTYKYADTDKQVTQYQIPVSTALQKEYALDDEKGHKIYPDVFRVSEDGSEITPVFYKGPEPTDRNAPRAVDRNLTHPMSALEFKYRYGKALFGAKEAVKESANSSGDSGIQWK